MKLDNEAQRQDLLEMLATVKVTVPLGQLQEQLAEYHRIIRPIIEAEIEEPPPPEKMVVPIEFLAPDTPNRIRRYAGMPELPGENGK